MKNKNILIINIHSFIDVITNSSSELFVVDKEKIKKEMQGFFNFILGMKEIDYESKVEKFTKYNYSNDIILPEGCKRKDCYVIHVSNGNQLLYEIVEKYFNPIDFKYKDDE